MFAAAAACDPTADERLVESVVADADAVVHALRTGEASDEAVATLRARGREGLVEVLEALGQPDRAGDEDDWNRLVDRVAGAHDAAVSGLFWETDLTRALAEAERRELPVLSLRMLGDLRERLSCANSRFFRTTLYADPRLARWLDENFVLHWSSERPVPVVEISMGDGRKLRTTTTGNSIHYVLDADGRVLDAVPGLYSPAGFRAALEESVALHEQVRAASETEAVALRRRHHAFAASRALARLTELMATVDPTLTQAEIRGWAESIPDNGGEPDAPSAQLAQEIAIGKSRVELPALREFSLQLQEARDQRVRRLLTSLAESRAGSVRFSDPTRALIRRDRPRRRNEDDEAYRARIDRTITQLAQSVAEDELHNELHLRVLVHRWLADDDNARVMPTLNERVYRELFLTPRADPWLGLVDDEVYDGLIEAGVMSYAG